MPAPLLTAYAEQLSRLSAEESLQAFERVAAGSGSLKRGVARQLVAAWQRATDRPRLVVRPTSREMYDAQMAMAGIGIQREPKRDG
jgi:hypothetical protein